MTSTVHTTSTGDVLRDAVRNRDVAAIAGLYEPDATIEIIDADRPPRDPQRLEGSSAVEAHLQDLYARDMTHEVDIVAQAPEALGYVVRCTYPDGTRVVCSSLSTLRNGRIAREVIVQAWDS
jgi:hypothetical protein